MQLSFERPDDASSCTELTAILQHRLGSDRSYAWGLPVALVVQDLSDAAGRCAVSLRPEPGDNDALFNLEVGKEYVLAVLFKSPDPTAEVLPE